MVLKPQTRRTQCVAPRFPYIRPKSNPKELCSESVQVQPWGINCAKLKRPHIYLTILSPPLFHKVWKSMWAYAKLS